MLACVRLHKRSVSDQEWPNDLCGGELAPGQKIRNTTKPTSPHARAAEGSLEHARSRMPHRQLLCAVPAFGGEDPVIFMHSAVMARSLHRSFFCSAGVVTDGPSRQLASEAHSCSRARTSAVRSGSCAARSSTALTRSAIAPDAPLHRIPTVCLSLARGDCAHRSVSVICFAMRGHRPTPSIIRRIRVAATRKCSDAATAAHRSV